MSRRIAMLSGILVLLLPTSVSAGWEGTDWGMSPEQVDAAVSGTKPIKFGGRLDVGRALRSAPVKINGEDRRAVYYFGDDGLNLVQVEMPPKLCSKTLSDLTASFGQPIRVSDQIVIRLLIWHDEPRQTRIRLMTSAKSGICNLNFERLSTYRSHDLEEAAR